MTFHGGASLGVIKSIKENFMGPLLSEEGPSRVSVRFCYVICAKLQVVDKD